METTGPGLSAAKLHTDPSTKGWGDRGFGHILEKPLVRGTVISHPPMCIPAQLRGPSPTESCIHVKDSRVDVMACQRPPTKRSPDHTPEVMQQTLSVGRDSVKLPPCRGGMWAFPPGPSICLPEGFYLLWHVVAWWWQRGALTTKKTR